MASRGETEIRRSQLIAPFGIGAMMVSPSGVSVICAGLDRWFDAESTGPNFDETDFVIQEWRLERYLGVEQFRLPPDFRESRRGQDSTNTRLTIPAWRFPLWHWCSWCKRLKPFGASRRDPAICEACQRKHKRKIEMVQVRFVAMCERGHLQDFPWREWVHRDENTSCEKTLYLKGTGGLGLGALRVECECGVQPRNLAQIMSANAEGETSLSKTLNDDGSPCLCKGHRPWFGHAEPEGCGAHFRGTLRNASNVYFADVRSAIYLPRGGAVAPDALVARLEQSPLSTVVSAFKDLGNLSTNNLLNTKHGRRLEKEFTREEIEAALQVIQGEADSDIAEDFEEDLRREEYTVLRRSQDSTELVVSLAEPSSYSKQTFPVEDYFSRIGLVTKLRETRVLTGFSRIFSENDRDLEAKKRMLWQHPPAVDESWLPATIVYGEGIYLELDEERLVTWENTDGVRRRADALAKRYLSVLASRRLEERTISPRLLLVHTLAHLLINQLTFDCGYSTASLRERLYVSESSEGEAMAGLLIYTAAGDSEGTLGGLVRMGTKGYLEGVLHRAIAGAVWCSADPVCMELGAGGGQGPDSCNNAACHNCALLPETSCELFNRFLDRGMVIGSIENDLKGFFADHFV